MFQVSCYSITLKRQLRLFISVSVTRAMAISPTKQHWSGKCGGGWLLRYLQGDLSFTQSAMLSTNIIWTYNRTACWNYVHIKSNWRTDWERYHTSLPCLWRGDENSLNSKTMKKYKQSKIKMSMTFKGKQCLEQDEEKT